MKKYVKILSVIALSLTLFTGCENFLSGGSLKEELQDILDYQYADYISIRLDYTGGEGTAKSGTDFKKKPTDKITISFEPDEDYAFKDWEILFSRNEEGSRSAMASEFTNDQSDLNEIFEELSISTDDKGIESITFKIKKTTDISQVIVKPYLERRPDVKSNQPAQNPTPVSRQTPIFVEFSQKIDENNFRFTAEELEFLGVIEQDPELDEEGNAVYHDAENFTTYKDEEGKYYAYKSNADSFTCLKNIEITTDDGIKSVADSYMPPKLENSDSTSSAILTIQPYSDPDKLIDIGNADYKRILVRLAKGIKNENGVEMSSAYTWQYQVNEETPTKARIRFTCNEEEGSIEGYLPLDETNYNISQKISLGFTEYADYQFIRWDFDEKYVKILDYNKMNATVLVIKDTPSGEPTRITAVCAPRLAVTDVDTGKPLPEHPEQVYRNSSLQVKFNNAIPSDDAGKKQLDNISITIGGGNSIRQCYTSPSFIDEKTILFASDRNNRLEIPDGQTKTVTLIVPADLYYEYEYKNETYKVTLGRDYTLNYTVSYETDDNAEVTFGISSTNAGTVTPSGKKSYAIGTSTTISFEPKDGWIFKGWKITSNDADQDSKIRLSSLTAKETKLDVLDEIKGVVITAECTEMLKVNSINTTSEKTSGTEQNPVYNKDTGFEIRLNKALDENCKLSDIKISCDGDNLSKSYTKTISSDRKTITLTNTKRPVISKDDIKNITITIPKSYYCTENGSKIGMNEEKSEIFAVNYMTEQKAVITFSIINGEDLSVVAAADACESMMPSSPFAQYNLDETVNLSFTENQDYQFYKWECDSSDLSITGKSSDAVLTVNGPATATVKAVVYARPSVKKILIHSETDADITENESTNVFPKDSGISIKFAHDIDADAINKIKLTYTGDNFNQNTYFKAEYDSASKTLKYTPLKILALRSGYNNETVTITIPADVYYIHKYKGTDRTTILASSGDDISRSYTILNETKSKTQVTYSYSSGSLSANGTQLSSGTAPSYSTDDSINYVFTPSPDSQFTGWNVTCASGANYDIVPSGFVTSGDIKIKSGNTILFTLQIDGQNPEKATAKVNAYISTGITVSASERLVAKVIDSSFTPKYESAGSNCDTPIVIPFNKAINKNTVSLYDNSSSTGSIQIINAYSAGTHYEQYYEIASTG